jgi:ATP-dependent DNA ligase
MSSNSRCTATVRGSGWLYDIKWDGYPVQAHACDGKVTVYTLGLGTSLTPGS